MNTVSGTYTFTNGEVNFYLNDAKINSRSIRINGKEINEISIEGNKIIETNNDFEIFQNGIRIFYYQGQSMSKKFIVVKNDSIPVMYIVETTKLSKEDVINKLLK